MRSEQLACVGWCTFASSYPPLRHRFGHHSQDKLTNFEKEFVNFADLAEKIEMFDIVEVDPY